MVYLSQRKEIGMIYKIARIWSLLSMHQHQIFFFLRQKKMSGTKVEQYEMSTFFLILPRIIIKGIRATRVSRIKS